MGRRSSGEGSITLRKDGVWCARLQVDGVRRSVYGRTRAEAASKLTDLKQQAAASGALPNPGKRTLNDLLDVWLETKSPNWKPRTLSDYRETCDRHVRPTLGRMPLAKVTPDRIQRLYTRLQAKDQQRTALKVHRVLSQALDLAARWSWLPSNPCQRTDTPRYQPQRKEVWTPEQLRTFLKRTDGHWMHPMWLFLVATGCRLGEALALTWLDADLESGMVSITKSAQRIDGSLVTTSPKTRAGVRRISLPQEALVVLRAHRASQAERRLRMGSRWEGGERVFTSRAGRPLAHSTVEWLMQRECERLRLPKLTPHGLRHLHASLLLSGGLPVPEVSRRLGHANAAITMSTYAHVMSCEDSEATAVVERALTGA